MYRAAIRKFRAGDHRSAEQRNVLGLALHAAETHAELLAFARDADDVVDDAHDYLDAIADARTRFPTLRIVGGLARPLIEGWVLAAHGVAGTDELSKSAAYRGLREAGIAESTAGYVEVIDASPLHFPPGHSLEIWLASAREELAHIIEP